MKTNACSAALELISEHNTEMIRGFIQLIQAFPGAADELKTLLERLRSVYDEFEMILANWTNRADQPEAVVNVGLFHLFLTTYFETCNKIQVRSIDLTLANARFPIDPVHRQRMLNSRAVLSEPVKLDFGKFLEGADDDCTE